MTKIEKIYYDQYQLSYRGIGYNVVVFPKIKDIWFEDMHPQEDTYDVNGSSTALSIYAHALALAIQEPNVIIYLPLKRNDKTYNQVLTRHELVYFKPSQWYKIKPLLKNSEKVSQYEFDYDKDELIRYYKEYIAPYENEISWNKYNKLFEQKVLGDTVFCRYSLDEIYCMHSRIVDSVKKIVNDPSIPTDCWGGGFVYSEKIVSEINNLEWRI